MKKHWKEAAGAIVRRQIEDVLRQPTRLPEGGLSWAESWLDAATRAWSVGCDIEPPQTPASDRIAKLREARHFAELNELYRVEGLSFEAEREQRNLTRWNAMRRWASEASHEERQAEELARAKETADAAAVEARAQELLAADNRAALERARAKARKELASAR